MVTRHTCCTNFGCKEVERVLNALHYRKESALLPMRDWKLYSQTDSSLVISTLAAFLER